MMKRSDLLRAAPLGLLAACAGGSSGLLSGGGSGLLVPSRRVGHDSNYAFMIGKYGFIGPGWIFARYSGWGYFIENNNTGNMVGYFCAFSWSPGSGLPGVQAQLGMGCTKFFPPQDCANVQDVAFATQPPKELNKWLNGEIREIFGNYFHIGDSVPSGTNGGTLKDPNGNKLTTAYKDQGQVYITQFLGGGSQYSAVVPWPGGSTGSGGLSPLDACHDGWADFGIALCAGIGGALTSEAIVGWAGVIGGGIGMIKSAYKIRDACR